jgi:phosphinothricin acetyltransferase
MPQVTSIYAHHVQYGTASFETEPPSLDEMRRRHAAILAHGLPWLVAVSGDDVLGYAYAGLYRPRAAYRDTVENSIYMRPDLIGRGIGKRLLATLVAACETRDLRQMIAVVGDSGNLGSVRLHQQCGFIMIGVLRAVGYKHGKWLDTVLLQKTLGRSDTAPPCRA